MPHSIPRKVQFLKELEKQLGLSLPRIRIAKAFSGDAPVAQKSLSKLSERVTNAEETLFVVDRAPTGGTILIIDDAVGSGATMNAIGRKLKDQLKAKRVVGFAIVGSYKGFDVIADI